MSGVAGWRARTPSMTRCAYGRLNSRNCSGDRWCAHESNSCTTCRVGVERREELGCATTKIADGMCALTPRR